MATSTLGSGTVVLAGTTSGTTTVTATAVAGTTTLTLPAATDTLVGKATTDTLTNKTLTSATLTGVVTFDAGTAAAPAITTTGDTNTGIFFPAADTIAFSEGGVEAARIDSSGRVGIGTDSPDVKLHVQNGTIRAKQTATASETLIHATNSGGNNITLWKQGSTATAYGVIAAENGALFGSSGDLCIVNDASSKNIIFANNGAALERMRIDSSGNLLVGTTSQISSARVSISGGGGGGGLAPLAMVNPAQATRTWNCGPDNGGNFVVTTVAATDGVFVSYGGTSWTSTSDERVKTTLVPFENAIEKVCTLRAGTGRYLKDEETVSRSFLIAQDVQAVLPEAVNVQNDEIGTLGLAYTDVIPLLVAAIKEQQALITALTARITALETP